MKQEFDPADFDELPATKGVLKLEARGETEEIEYTARNFVNKERTVGYSASTGDGLTDCMFLSNTKDGMLLTMPGEERGAVPLKLDGYKTIYIIETEATPELSYKAHLEAIKDVELLSDEAWMKKEVPDIPHKAVKAMSNIFEAAADLMEGLVTDLGEAIDGVMEQIGAQKVCGECNAEVDAEDKTCPKCGKAL